MSAAEGQRAPGEAVHQALADWHPYAVQGRVDSQVGLLVEAAGIAPPVGSACAIDCGSVEIDAEVVGFRGDRTLLMPLAEATGLRPGAPVRVRGSELRVPIGPACLGRILDGLGRPIDGAGPLFGARRVSVYAPPTSPVDRQRIERPLPLGVRAIDSFSTLGQGMRMGIFAGSGVGKSTLLGQVAAAADVDLCVIALIGERRREVREFLERDLGDARARSVVVVATSDEAASLRVRAAQTATRIAEGFRDEGASVLLMMDSVTRFCTAQREIGVATGEPPTTRGYTPSVWSGLARLVERAGTTAGAGSITGLYTVLVEGDDMNEPVADAARSLLDGHIELSRKIAEQGRYPAIDVLRSLSRVMQDVTDERHRSLATRAREALATFRDAEDLIAVGAYREGSDPAIDRARALVPALQAFLAQGRDEQADPGAALEALASLLGEVAA